MPEEEKVQHFSLLHLPAIQKAYFSPSHLRKQEERLESAPKIRDQGVYKFSFFIHHLQGVGACITKRRVLTTDRVAGLRHSVTRTTTTGRTGVGSYKVHQFLYSKWCPMSSDLNWVDMKQGQMSSITEQSQLKWWGSTTVSLLS